MMSFKHAVFASVLSLPIAWMSPAAYVDAAEATTGSVIGEVFDSADKPIANAQVAAASPSGRAQTQTGADGRFTLLGLAPDTYAISAQATGFEATSVVTVVLAGQTQRMSLSLARDLHEIARVRARNSAFTIGSTSDTFVVSGAAARAIASPYRRRGSRNTRRAPCKARSPPRRVWISIRSRTRSCAAEKSTMPSSISTRCPCRKA